MLALFALGLACLAGGGIVLAAIQRARHILAEARALRAAADADRVQTSAERMRAEMLTHRLASALGELRGHGRG